MDVESPLMNVLLRRSVHGGGDDNDDNDDDDDDGDDSTTSSNSSNSSCARWNSSRGLLGITSMFLLRLFFLADSPAHLANMQRVDRI